MASMRNILALNDPDPKEMTIVEHLEELRRRLIICIATVTGGSAVGWFFKDWLFGVLDAPLRQYHISLIVTKVTDFFVINLLLSVAIGIALVLPVLLYQTWMFIAPAVDLKARRYTVPFVLVGIVLFAIGAVIGYLIFPRVVGFLVGQGSDLVGVKLLPTLPDYIKQFALVIIIFGLVFELPVVLTFLSMLGVVSSHFLRSKRRYAWMLGLIVAMIITPGADPFTPFITWAIVNLLYEVSILSVRLLHR